MKIGIDSYSYHRYFGEVYDNQKDPGVKYSTVDFINKAIEFGVQGVSLETCFVESFEEDFLKELKALFDKGGITPMVAWGHVNGLEGGKKPEAVNEIKEHFRTCNLLGADVMRIVGSSLAFRHEPSGPQIERLVSILKEPIKMAEDHGIKLAMENHFDFTTDEIQEILSRLPSDNFGVTFDTGNSLRIGDDPVDFAKKLADKIFATHIKDVAPLEGGNPDDWFYQACVPIGKGNVDIPAIVRILKTNNYKGLLAVEFDFLDPKYGDETEAMTTSLEFLRQTVDSLV